MTHPDDLLPLDDFIERRRDPDGIDLADMEATERRLATEREAIAKKTILVPGKKKSMLSELDTKVGKLSMAIQVGKEVVRPDPVKSKIYEQRRAELLEKERCKAEAANEAAEIRKRQRDAKKVREMRGENELDPTD